MLKMNSRKALENTDNYLLQFADDIAAENKDVLSFDYDLQEIGDLCKCIYNYYFMEEAVRFDKRLQAGRISLQELFIEWTQGLPACGVFDFWTYRTYCDPVAILGDILEETTEEREKFTDQQAAEKLTYMIWKRLNYYISK